jgi:hypothetical protein
MVEALKALANWLVTRRLRAERKNANQQKRKGTCGTIRPDSETNRALILMFAPCGVQPFFG